MTSIKIKTKGNIKLCLKHYGETESEQIKINRQGLEIFKKWQEEDNELTEMDIQQAEDTWEMVKKIIDENRNRKLFH